MALKTDREKTAHLLRRFGLGASEAEVDYYSEGGVNRAIDRLLDFEKTDEGFEVDILRFQNPNPNVRFPNLPLVEAWWLMRLLITQRPLQEKMAIFWHDHFATSAAKVNSPPAIYRQNETLRRNCVGDFRTFLIEMSKDPAMIYWLDNQTNVQGKPNENFARELMELFTVGIGNYTEEEVYEVARCFTGWSFGQPGSRRVPDRQPLAEVFVLRLADKDNGEKTFRGKTGNLSGEDVIHALCDDPQSSRYLTTKLWEFFVYEKPEKDLVERFAKGFRDAGLNIKALLRAIMESEEFYSARAERKVVKNPVDFVVPTLRQLGVGASLRRNLAALGDEPIGRGQLGPAFATQRACQNMGMRLLYPPDVAGWEHGRAWITSATMVQRIAWGDALFAPRRPGAPAGRGQSLAIPIFDVVEERTPEVLADRMVSLFDAPVTDAQREQMRDAAKSAALFGLTPRNAGDVAATVARLMFGTPEFQFA